MRHPEILLLPVLMFADYWLTIAGAVLREGAYAERFRSEHYELNPVLQPAIRKKKWFSARHVAGVVIATGATYFLFEVSPAPDELRDAMLGFFVVYFGALIGRHLSNILTFRRMNRAAAQAKPEVTGQVTMAHSLTLSISAFQYLSLAVPLTLLAAFHPAPIVLGGCAGAWLLLLTHGIWIWRHERTAVQRTMR